MTARAFSAVGAIGYQRTLTNAALLVVVLMPGLALGWMDSFARPPGAG